MKTLRLIQISILLLITACAGAQDIEFSAVVSPNVLRVGEQFNLIYTCNQEMTEFNLPDVRDFDLLGGPSQGHSQNFSSINGKITTSSTYQYTYFFRAAKEGKFTLPPATIKYKNRVYQSNSVTVEVIKGNNTASSQNQSSSQTSQSQSSGGQISDDDLFVRIILDKRNAYVGEQIMATIKIYTKTRLSGVDPNFKGPDFTGFFTEPVETPPLRRLDREVVDGEIYNTGVLRRMVIIPQKTGELTLEPFDLDVAVRREVRRRIADPFFDDFSVPDVQEIPVKIKSKPVKVYVKPLPLNPPASFKGAVGNYRISSSLSSANARTNEPLTLKITLSGKGNLKLVNEIAVNVPYDMERFDPVINTRMENALSGSKTFEYLIMPKVPGDFTLLPAEFTYFDPDAGKYISLRTQTYSVHVEKGEGDTLMGMTPGVSKEDVMLLNQDIRFIKTKPSGLSRIDSFLTLSVVYYLIYVLIFLMFLAIILILKRYRKQNADIAGTKLRKADRYARKRLKKCEALLKQGKDEAFYEEMLGALWGYLSHKLNIPVSLLSKDTARQALVSRSVKDELITKLFDIMNVCEIARYSRSAGEISRNDLYHEAIRTIASLQQELR